MEPPAAPDSPTTPLQSFPSLCISEPPVSDAPLATHDPLEDLSSSQLLQNSDDESESDDERDGITPSLRTNTLPPQLGALELPSPVFGRSFVDLLDFSTPASTTPIMTGLVPGPRAARQRTPSILDSLRSSLYAPSSAGPPPQHLREPTLTFSVPRTLKDDRRRREGKDEDVWVGVFPSPEEECELGDRVNVSEWGVAEWDEVRGFVEMRGYAIDEQSSWPNLFAHRISDSLPLSVFIIPTDDDSSYELDVLEHLSSAGLRSKAKTMKTIPCVPLVGIVPMNEEWTAVLVERWEELGPSRIEGVEFQGLVEDIVGAIAFLHSQHISHLSLSPRAIVRSSHAFTVSSKPRHHHSLTAFHQSHQGDGFAATKGKKVLISSEGIEAPTEGWKAPELVAGGRVNPKGVDLWGMGRLIGHVAEIHEARSQDLDTLVVSLTQPDPNARPSAAEILKQVRVLQLD